VHRPLGEKGQDRGPDVAAASPGPAPSAPVAGTAAAGELGPVVMAEMSRVMSVVHLKYLSIDI